MPVILANTKPPLEEVAKLGRRPTEIYLILFNSAARDIHYDKNKSMPYEHRRDCGGTTSWSIQALACETKACRKLVANAIGKLLDTGFITVVGMAKSNVGKRHKIFRVIHPDQLEAQRQAIALFAEKPSVRWKNYGKKRGSDTQATWHGDTDTKTDADADADAMTDEHTILWGG